MIENTASISPVSPGDQPAEYLIRVRGWLDPNWFEFHQELSITATALPDRLPETVLQGRVSDQSALIGILSTLHHFGLTLLLVELIQPESATSSNIL